ncbi:MAG: TonB-dependent receptor domain-containing protein [Flavobacterium sp.]
MYKYIVTTAFLLFSMLTFSQSEVTGTVTFENNQPLPGANVFWQGTETGTVTDAQGKFKLQLSEESSVLVVSYVGFATQTRTITNPGDFRFRMEFDSTLDEVTLTKVRSSLQRNRLTTANVQTMTAKELTKAACCNLSESFETNPSIDVNFSDAVSGTRQIRMLGLTSPYIAMTEENILAMRGGSQYAGLSFIPGPWVHSIQITKGAGSVINGYESISGQINYEFLRPEEEPRLFINAFAGMGGRYELNTHYNTTLNEHWSTGLFVHGNFRNEKNDMNKDGFLDNPLMRQINLMNIWKYGICGKTGISTEFKWRFFADEKQSGEVDFDPIIPRSINPLWGSEINTRQFLASAKVGYVFPELEYQSIGFQNQFSDYRQDGYYGNRDYFISHQSWYSNLLFASIINNTLHKFTTGASFQWDRFEELYEDQDFSRKDVGVGAFFEYSYNNDDDLSYTLGGRADYHNRMGVFLTPRAHIRYQPAEQTTLRASVGRGKRLANIFMENQNLFASNRAFMLPVLPQGDNGFYNLNPEIAWNYGISMLQKFKIFGKEAELGLDLYRTDFQNQVVVDLDASAQQVQFYNLDGQSFANSLQLDFNINPATHLEWRNSYKFYDVRNTNSIGLEQRILQPRHRFFTNLAYETHLRDNGKQWKFDATYNWLGRQRMPVSTANPTEFQWNSMAPSFFTINAQVTRVFSKNFEIYVGGENMNNYRQPNAIIAATDPFGDFFDSSMIYGPVFGAMYYAGLRWKIN